MSQPVPELNWWQHLIRPQSFAVWRPSPPRSSSQWSWWARRSFDLRAGSCTDGSSWGWKSVRFCAWLAFHRWAADYGGPFLPMVLVGLPATAAVFIAAAAQRLQWRLLTTVADYGGHIFIQPSRQSYSFGQPVSWSFLCQALGCCPPLGPSISGSAAMTRLGIVPSCPSSSGCNLRSPPPRLLS